MKDSIRYYAIGALLYCPANTPTIARAIIEEKFEQPFSLALCLEDTIRDHLVQAAEAQLIASLAAICDAQQHWQFFLPKIFIRVRESAQIPRLLAALGACRSIVTGFILPKFSLENADEYIAALSLANAQASPLYMMPILESPSMVHLQNRHQILYALKQKLDAVQQWVLNIRVGGNDLCNVFGFRRHANETIYDIPPISSILSDIITVFGQEYVVSGPVWEYYNGADWEQGLRCELSKDKAFGFVGKTVIHPNQIPVVNHAYQISQTDYADALSILEWSTEHAGLVSHNPGKERMNEFKTHYNWAMKMQFMAQAYGIHPFT